jgi:hypothetical protein
MGVIYFRCNLTLKLTPFAYHSGATGATKFSLVILALQAYLVSFYFHQIGTRLRIKHNQQRLVSLWFVLSNLMRQLKVKSPIIIKFSTFFTTVSNYINFTSLLWSACFSSLVYIPSPLVT